MHTHYAVAKTPEPNGAGIYDDWSAAMPFCIDAKTGHPFKGAVFKKFKTKLEAEEFINKFGSKNHDAVKKNKSALCYAESSLQDAAVSTVVSSNKKRPSSEMASSDENRNIKKQHVGATAVENSKAKHLLHVYTDGACHNNGKKNARAGYGVYFGEDDARNAWGPLGKNEAHTNQRAELRAILEALRITSSLAENEDSMLIIHSDSQYSMNCLTNWLPKWRTNGFLTANKTPVLNLDLIKPIDGLIRKRGPQRFKFEYVPGHIGVPGNEAADKLASKGALSSSS